MARKAKAAKSKAAKSRAAKSRTTKTKARKPAAKRGRISHLGMMGDGTEEQSLSERGNPRLRISEAEVTAAFGKRSAKKAARR